MRILLFLIYLFSSLSLADESTYLQSSFIFATRNFEEATPTNTNDGIESWTEGFSIGGGHRFSTSFAIEFEYLKSDGFKVQNQNQTGEISVYALTISPVYIFKPSFFPEEMEMSGKLRVGYTKMQGTNILGNNGKESSLTIGLGVATTYRINKNWSGLVDIGGLWANEDIEDFDFIPLQVGIRFHF